MPAGRPPKPTPLKALQGTLRPDRANPNEPTLPVATPAPPSWLAARGRRLWRELAPVLEDMRVVTAADRQALALLCDALGEYADARAVITKQGVTYEAMTASGAVMVRPRPEVTIAADAWRRASAMLQQFGLTPSARGKVTARPPETRDEFEELFGAGG